jgi:hypothetical protein
VSKPKTYAEADKRIAELEAERDANWPHVLQQNADLKEENAKLREYKDKDLESHKLRVVMKENAKLRKAIIDYLLTENRAALDEELEVGDG